MKRIILVMAWLIPAAFTLNAQTYIIQVKPSGSKFWGYANLKGEMIIPAQFEKCYRFSEEGFAIVYDEKARQFLFINPKGERLTTEITSFKLHDAQEGFNNGMAGIKVG